MLPFVPSRQMNQGGERRLNLLLGCICKHHWVCTDGNLSSLKERYLHLCLWAKAGTWVCAFLDRGRAFLCVSLQLTEASCCSNCLFLARLRCPLALDGKNRLQNHLLDSKKEGKNSTNEKRQDWALSGEFRNVTTGPISKSAQSDSSHSSLYVTFALFSFPWTTLIWIVAPVKGALYCFLTE